MDNDTVIEAIHRAVTESIGNSEPIDAKHLLLESGLLDSLILVQIVVAIQSEFSVTIEVDEINEENFQDIESIAALVVSKRAL